MALSVCSKAIVADAIVDMCQAGFIVGRPCQLDARSSLGLACMLHRLRIGGNAMHMCTAGAVESQLQEAAKLQHTEPAIRQLARSTKTISGQLRFGLGVLNAISRAAVTKQLLQQRAAS